MKNEVIEFYPAEKTLELNIEFNEPKSIAEKNVKTFDILDLEDLNGQEVFEVSSSE